MAAERVFARSDVEFVDRRMDDEIRPFVSFLGDAEGWTFTNRARIDVPALIDILVRSQGAYADFMVDIHANLFSERHDIAWQVTVSMVGGEVIGTCRFWKWYAQHQFIIPLWKFHRSTSAVHIVAEPLGEMPDDAPAPVFTVSTLYCNQAKIWRDLEERSIWLFSTARSGSTWLAQDILGWRHRSRLVDESGIGRMFAPMDREPERIFRIERNLQHFESGLAYETGELLRSSAIQPPFERSFRDLSRELQILNFMNFEMFHKMLKECVFQQVLNEWGVRNYDRLVFKLPNDSQGADFIMRAFPRSHMIFLMRDGRDVMRSRFTPFASPTLAETNDAELRKFAVAYYAHLWNFEVEIIQSAFDAHPADRRHFLTYEGLRLNPRETIENLLNNIGMPLTGEEMDQLVHDVRLENMPAATRGPDKARQEGRVGGFRDQFSDEEIHIMDTIMRDNLIRYGYQVAAAETPGPVAADPD